METCQNFLTRNLAPHLYQGPSRLASFYIGFESNLLLLSNPSVSHFRIDSRCYPSIQYLYYAFFQRSMSHSRFSYSSLHWVKSLHSWLWHWVIGKIVIILVKIVVFFIFGNVLLKSLQFYILRNQLLFQFFFSWCYNTLVQVVPSFFFSLFLSFHLLVC